MQRHLGLVLTSDLRWTAHVNQVLSKAARLLHTLKRLRCTLSKAALTLYYCLYICPVVEYGCVAWPKLPAHLRDRLERFQRRAFKVILRKPLFEHCDHDAIDNFQNYCLGTRYGARSRPRLCRRLSISLVRYRHGLEKFLEHHFIPIRRRFNPHDPPTDLLRVQDPFCRGRRPIFSTGNDGAWPAMGTPSMAWQVLFLCGRSSLT